MLPSWMELDTRSWHDGLDLDLDLDTKQSSSMLLIALSLAKASFSPLLPAMVLPCTCLNRKKGRESEVRLTTERKQDYTEENCTMHKAMFFRLSPHRHGVCIRCYHTKSSWPLPPIDRCDDGAYWPFVAAAAGSNASLFGDVSISSNSSQSGITSCTRMLRTESLW